MDTVSVDMSQWKHRLVAELTRDKKKTAVLGILALVGVIVVARLAFTGAAKPSAASAAATATLVPPTGLPQTPGQVPCTPGQPRRGQRAREAYLAAMDRTIDRDLFQPNLDYFPVKLTARSTVTVPAEPVGPGFFDKVGEYLAETQRAHGERLAHIQNIRAQAQALSLTSTMLGDSPAAMISGRVLHVGEYISGFRVEQIGSSKCSLVRDGVRVELHMER